MADDATLDETHGGAPSTRRIRKTSPRWAATATAIAVTVVVSSIAAVTVTSLIDRGRWEQAVIGLTAESEWPLHDVHLATAAGQLDDPQFVRDVQREQGLASADDIVVQVDRQRQAGNGTLTISARADSSADAATMANAVAAAVVSSVPADTPIRLVDQADVDPTTASVASIAGSGALVGLLIGIVLWLPAFASLEPEQRQP